MNAKEKIKKVLKNPKWFFIFLNNRGLHLLNDKNYLSLLYKLETGKKLNLNSPLLFNEKMQWLKLNNRKDIYSIMVDKYEAKKYVSEIIGEKYIIPTLGIYDSFDEIDFNGLPNQFVIKCTHDSGGLVIVKDKNNLDIESAKKKINKCLKKNFYWAGREWPYKNVEPRILIEKYLEDKKTKELRDYKFFCFNGKPKLILVCSERFSSNNMCETWFDDKWNLMDIIEGGHRIDKSINKPEKFDEMKKLAKKLSQNIPFLRVDFYEIDEKIYFGELTFFPASGFERFEPNDWNYKLGQLIDLSKVDKSEK